MKQLKLLTAISLIALPAYAMADDHIPSGDAAAGENVFKKCRACHVADEDKKKIGPSLMNIFGRQAGTHPDFRYSNAMVEAGEGGLVWTPEIMFEYLEKPRDYIKGTRMAFPGLRDEQDRADVIAYLQQFSEPMEGEMEGEEAASE